MTLHLLHRFLKPILILSVFLLLFASYFKTITALTQDLGRHLKTGEIILTTGIVPKTNLFSYTYPDYTFINHHWLSQVIFYVWHGWFGFFGLLILTSSLVTVAFGLLFFYTYKRYSFPVILFSSFVYLRILFERTDLRPELFSFFFLSVFLFILFTYRERFTKLIYLLPLLSLLWVNLHIYFFTGIVVIFLFFIEALFHKKLIQTRKHIQALCLVLIMCILVSFINPNGIEGAMYPLRIFQNYGYTIEENQTFYLLESLGFQKPSIPFFKLGVLLLFSSLLINFQRARMIDWLLSISFTIIGCMAVRNFPLFVFATFISLVFNLTGAVMLMQAKLQSYSPTFSRFFRLGGYILLLLFFIIQAKFLFSQNSFGYRVDDAAGPGVAFFRTHSLKGPVFNNFDIGSYFEYKLFPEERVFVDGRPEAYPASFLTDVYIPMQQDQGIFEKVSQKYRFNTIFFSHADQTPWAQMFLQNIVRNTEWQIIYLDSTIVILAKQNDTNREIINRFGIQPETLTNDYFTNSTYDQLLRYALFFNVTKLPEQELMTYQKILTINPSFCPAIYNTGILLSQKGDAASAIYAQRYQAQCS